MYNFKKDIEQSLKKKAIKENKKYKFKNKSEAS